MSKAFIYGLTLLLGSFALLSGSLSKLQAQPSCEISIDKAIPVCPKSKFQLSVPPGDNYKYLWKKDGDSIANTPSILWTLTETAEFVVRVTDTLNFEECESDPFVVDVHTPINVEFEQRQLTCTNGDNANGNNAKVKAIASGEFEADEYHYFWDVKPIQVDPVDSSVAQGLKAHLIYNITIKDNYGCSLDTGFRTEAYDNPLVEIYSEPDSIAYIQKPDVAFFFDNLSSDSIDIIDHFWVVEIGDPAYPDSVLDDLPPDPVVTFKTVGIWPVHLTVYNNQGCDTTYNSTIEIKPVELFIPNVFTPNNDGINDKFIIAIMEDGDQKNRDILLRDYYRSSKLVVFNRWGRVVFQSDDYDNEWDGGKLSDGVYYYVLKCEGAKSNDVFKGAVTIVGTGSRQ